jgi:hypothetical protein
MSDPILLRPSHHRARPEVQVDGSRADQVTHCRKPPSHAAVVCGIALNVGNLQSDWSPPGSARRATTLMWTISGLMSLVDRSVDFDMLLRRWRGNQPAHSFLRHAGLAQADEESGLV